jgi:DNA-binding beta-propeller fold protein YncE
MGSLDLASRVAVYGNLVYVLHAGGTGSVSGYRIFGDRLFPLPGSSASLGLNNTGPPNFLQSPGEIGFSPDGTELLVTTKASTSSIDVFSVGSGGQLSANPAVTADASNVPFSFSFSPQNQLVVAEPGPSVIAYMRRGRLSCGPRATTNSVDGWPEGMSGRRGHT